MLQIKPAIWLSANFILQKRTVTEFKMIRPSHPLWHPPKAHFPLGLLFRHFCTFLLLLTLADAARQSHRRTWLLLSNKVSGKKKIHLSSVPFFHESQVFPMLWGTRSGKYSTVLGLRHCGQEPILILAIGYTKGMVYCPSALCKSTSIRIAWIQEKAKSGHTCLYVQYREAETGRCRSSFTSQHVRTQAGERKSTNCSGHGENKHSAYRCRDQPQGAGKSTS